MVVDRDTVRRLSEELEKRLRRLAKLAAVTEDEYLADEALQDRVERNLEVATQCAIDMGQHILASLGSPTPDTYREVFLFLAKERVIPAELAERLAAMAQFRNVLVHGYVAIDHRLVYRSLQKIDDLREFVSHVFRYMGPS